MPQDSRGSASHRNSIPDVQRPALEIWQTLESERIRWEGQVQIVGQESDLPALLVITGKRLALIANNEIALEFPLGWMRPEPKLVAENGIRLYISPDGNSQIAQPMLLRARSGKAAAMEIAAVLTGRSFASRDSNSPMHIPAWRGGVGASPSVALPQLRDDATSGQSSKKAAWPPAETAGVQARPMQDQTSSNAPRPSASIAPWRVGSSVPKPTPVPSGTSRAQRLLGTSSDGFTITDEPRRADGSGVVPNNQRKHRVPMWLLNLAVIALVLAGFGYVAHDRGYGVSDLQSVVPSNVANYLGIDDPKDNGEIAQAPTEETLDPTEEAIQQGGDNRLLPVTNTQPESTEAPQEEEKEPEADSGDSSDSTDSIGGSSGQLPITQSVFSTPDAEETEAPIETEVATETPVETEAPEETEVVTDEPTETEVAPEEPTETEVSTEDPTETEVATEEPSVTEVATEEPTVTEAATEAPTDPTIDPTVVEPTETPVTPEPTVAPTQEVSIEQPASVEKDEIPNQAFAQGGIRYSVDAVATGAGIESLPEVNVIDGTWVVITMTGANNGAGDATFDMNGFTLLADGNSIPLDSGTSWVNSLLGNDPAYGNTDTATWAAGEQHQFTLVFRAPANASSLTLVAGDQQIALDPSITNTVGLNEVATDTAPASTVTGTVTEVIDGQTIVVDVDGELITVRYLGIDAPVGEACYSSESTLINAGLVEGQTVTLERQSVDTNARGLWVRDVWVTDANGNQVLVSQALVSQGAATTNVSEPNSRYAGWLGSTEQEAQSSETGIWGTCGGN